MLTSGRARPRFRGALVVLTVLVSGFGATGAHATGEHPADAGLSMSGIGFGGTGDRVKAARTPLLRDALPGGSARVLLIGTGVERALFPTTLRDAIAGSGRDLTDPHGYGTLAASVLFQLLPDARVTSRAVRAHDAAYHLLRMDDLADALEHARANASRFDLVLLAYPPQAALDPIAHLIGHGDYGRFGTGMDMVVQALLTSRTGIHGIPAQRALRDRVFEGLNLRQRDAVERFVERAKQWEQVTGALSALDRTGVPIVSPAGDYTRTEGEQVRPLPTQTIFGLAAEESVITVGASYADGAVDRVSPTSGRGPTLGLGAKPDLVAPADVMAMLPAGAQLPWPDDSLRAPLNVLQWAKAGTAPSPCPSLQGVYRCVLQGSSMVSASVVAANLAASVAGGVPSRATARDALDDEVLRGIAWAQASKVIARASEGGEHASVWAQGAGVFGGLKGLDASRTPVALARPHLGDVSFTRDATTTIPLWQGGALAVAHATTSSLTGPGTDGATFTAPFVDPTRVRVQQDAFDVRLRAVAGRYQGGVYAGVLTLTPPAGDPAYLPLSYTQTLPLDFHASYAYNELTGGEGGERVEDASVLLLTGLPRNVGLFGTAFKNLSGKAFKNVGGDPTNSIMVRTGRTKNSFTGDAPSEHGSGRIPSVPPGFYKIHLLADHGFDARQERGRGESLGIRLGTFGPETAFAPGADLLLASQPACDGDGAVRGPLDGCLRRSGEIDPTNGLCTASNPSTKVSFNIACGPVSFAVPSAVVSRAVHLIEHDRVPARSEWRTCGIDVPVNGQRMDFASLAVEAEDCPTSATVPTAWTFGTGSPGCLAPEERAAFPGGHPTDVTATYSGAAAPGLPGRNFPVAVLSYGFALPEPNTYTTAALSLSYVADNAIVGVRFVAGEDALSDASTGLLVVDDPDVAVSPVLKRAPSAGSAFTEWGVMSANARRGTLSLFVIPTAWVRPDLNPAKPIAKVDLCDVALRVSTFAKADYGQPQGTPPLQTFGTTDHGLLDQIDPSVSRVRPVHSGGAFTGAGVERESLTVAVHLPKNTTQREAGPHHVLSPIGGPAYLRGLRGPDGSSVAANARAHDPGFGITWLGCSRSPDLAELDIDRNRNAATCTAYEEARAANDIIAELTPDVGVNGRFYGVLALDHAQLSRAAGDLAVDVLDADDGGAFESRWARAGSRYERLFPVSDFYDEAAGLPLTPLGGLLRIARDASGAPVLHVDTAEIGGAAYRISSVLE